MTPSEAPRPPRYTMLELIFGGDFACAENQPGTLAEVARTLGARVGASAQRDLQEVARLANVDMTAASDLWSSVTARLRSPTPRA
ncbi:MAG TPA: hypothetical protein VM734_31320 [Kofleriaceae bacterium]|nr:hypothetical protein [Kofleriaceae bacterium]